MHLRGTRTHNKHSWLFTMHWCCHLCTEISALCMLCFRGQLCFSKVCRWLSLYWASLLYHRCITVVHLADEIGSISVLFLPPLISMAFYSLGTAVLGSGGDRLFWQEHWNLQICKYVREEKELMRVIYSSSAWGSYKRACVIAWQDHNEKLLFFSNIWIVTYWNQNSNLFVHQIYPSLCKPNVCKAHTALFKSQADTVFCLGSWMLSQFCLDTQFEINHPPKIWE